MSSSLNTEWRQFAEQAAFQLTPTTIDEYKVLKQQRGHRAQEFLKQPAFALLANKVSVQNTTISLPIDGSPQYNLRVYRPADALDSEDLPVLCFFHGGYWLGGDINSEDLGNRAIIARGNRIVSLSFEYRLIPEVDWTTQFLEAESFVRWTATNAAQFGGNIKKGFLVGGAEAGAHLAAITAIRLCNAGNSPLTGQLLIVPVTLAWPETKLPEAWKGRLESHTEQRDAPLLPNALFEMLVANLGMFEEERRRGENFPAWEEHLEGLPPAYIAVVCSIFV